MKTRAEYLAWCKRRALAYVDIGELFNAIMLLKSDLSKHPETKTDTSLLMPGMAFAQRYDRRGVRRWIEEFE